MSLSKEEILGNMSFIEFDFKVRNSFKFFCERLLGITTMGGIHDFQLEWIKAVKNNKYVVIKAATGHSKTMTLGVWHTLWQCYKNDHMEILVVSKNLAQAKNTFRHIRTAIELNPILSEIFGNEKTARVWNEQFIETKQFNTIRVVPYTSSIRSYRAHFLYCVPKNTKIFTDTGSERIEDIKEGDMVMTHKGSFKKVLKTFHRETSEKMYEIYNNEMKLKLTINHPLFIKRGRQNQFKRSDRVRVGDMLTFPTRGREKYFKISKKRKGLKEFSNVMVVDRDMSELMGYYVAEGCCRKSDIGFTFNSKGEDEYLNRVEEILKKKFGGIVTWDKSHSWATSLFYSSVNISDTFENLFGKGALNKKIPNCIKNSPNHVKFRFIEALINGDGHWGKRYYRFTTSSKQLSLDFRDILKSVGIKSKIRECINHKGSYGSGNLSYYVNIGIREARMIKSWSNSIVERKYMNVPITEIKEKRSTGHVYNLEVEDNNSYIANGITTHNCDEVDSFEETETYFEDVLSRLHPGGRIILTSTPKGATNLLAQIEEQDIEGKYHWITTPAIVRKDGTHFDPETFTLDDIKDAKSIWPEMFPVKVIEEKWFVQGKWKFISQQLCMVLGETENTPFSLKTIINCYDKNLSFSKEVSQKAIYFIGNDFASSEGKKADFTTYVVIEFVDDVFTLKWIEVLPKGTQTPEKMVKLKELYEIYNEFGTCRVVADATNLGVEIVPKIRNAGLSLIEQPFQWRLRREMIKTVSNVMQNGGSYVKIPKKGGPEKINNNRLVDELQKQLAGFLLVKSSAGNENYKSTVVHDDIAIAFMMALKEASKMSISTVSPRVTGKNNQRIRREDSMVRVSGDKNSNQSNNGFVERENPGVLRNRKESLVRIVR